MTVERMRSLDDCPLCEHRHFPDQRCVWCPCGIEGVMSVSVSVGGTVYDPQRGMAVTFDKTKIVVNCPACEWYLVLHLPTQPQRQELAWSTAHHKRSLHTKYVHGELLTSGAMTLHLNNPTVFDTKDAT